MQQNSQLKAREDVANKYSLHREDLLDWGYMPELVKRLEVRAKEFNNQEHYQAREVISGFAKDLEQQLCEAIWTLKALRMSNRVASSQYFEFLYKIEEELDIASRFCGKAYLNIES